MHTNTTGGPTDRPVLHRRPEDAADQPTTEPTRQDLIDAVFDFLDQHGPTDLGYDDTKSLAVRLVDATGSLYLPAPQPAADTETEVQWGVRYHEGGKVIDTPMENEEHARSLARIVDATVVHRTVTRTPWEEA